MKNIVYAAPQRAMEKLKYARSLAETVYIGGAAGYGKTELIRQYLKSRNYIYLSCEEEDWTADSLRVRMSQMRAKSAAADVTVVIDDVQDLLDEDRRGFLLSIAAKDGIWLILAGRSPQPEWLKALSLPGNLVRIRERDLALEARDVALIFEGELDGTDLEMEDAGEAAGWCEGNPLMIHYLAELSNDLEPRPKGTWKLTEKLKKACGQQYRDYLNASVISNIDPDVVKFCMEVSVVDEFNADLAEFITGKANAIVMMNQLRESSSGLLHAGKGGFRFRPHMLLAFRERRDRTYDVKKVRELCYNAGLYYETHDRFLEAAAMYEKSGSGRIRNILILNARKNPSSGYYHELKKYYLALTEDEISENVYLMSGMSMLCSLLMAPDQSEHWYRELRRYSENTTGGMKREAEVQVLFLDISLPQRGVTNLADIFRRMPAVVFNRGYSLPEFSVTSNLPSMMDGGKDFSEWSRHDRALASSLGPIVSRALGKYGRGLVPLALAESQYEKAGDPTEIVTWVSQGQMLAQNGGKIEMEFVAVRLLACMSMISGRSEDAVDQLTAFREKAVEHEATRLLDNIDALVCRIELLTGDTLAVEEWMRRAPDEIKDFFVMERLLYLTKIRCYIMMGQYLRATSLAEKLLIYSQNYHRTIVNIETELLMAILCYRQKKDTWRDHLTKGLRLAGEHGFIRTVSSEGTAILPLLKELMKDPDLGGLKETIPDDWFKRVVLETDRIARRYPAYLQENNARGSDFSRKDIDVLTLQAKGFSVPQIATALSMKPETVRYHIKQNYRRLQVSSKSEAVLAARDIGLL